MSLAKLLIITCFMYQSAAVYRGHPTVARCQKILFRYDVSHSGPGNKGGSIAFRFEGNRADFHIYLLNRGNKQQLPQRQSELTGLPPGKYTLVITGRSEAADYCPEFLEIEVK
jgi:hypothetical protein